ncbi:MAG TPA: BamA/TamA family outer membrane protein [Bacteroidales bacterium]|nr:BamA/TamA family outer membrane protein [Bacteroidales bacterium]
MDHLRHKTCLLITILAAGILLAITSCSPARHVAEGDHLLSRNKVESTQKVISGEQLNSYILQKPNKKILGLRFHLFLYNLSNINKTKWPHNWLRRIGEEPAVYDPGLTTTSSEQLKQFLENKGYYFAEITDTVVFRRKNAVAYYGVNPGEPYIIKRITHIFEDTGLISHVMPDSLNSLLRRGMKFDKDILQNERVRIENLLKEQGYYRFSKEYIYYNAEIDPAELSVDLHMHFKEFVEGKPDPWTKIKYHPKYRFGKVFIYPDVTSSGTGRGTPNEPDLLLDTTVYQGQNFLTTGRIRLKPPVITNISYIMPGQLYKQSNVNRTQRNITELGLVRYTNILFSENDTLSAPGADKLLDCEIQLTRKKIQSYQIELAGTNSAGDFGIRGNLLYQNLNLFRGAEVFHIRLTGAIEALQNRSNDKYSSMQEAGTQTSIVFPKFFSPFRLSNFVRKYSPKTSLSASFNYQSRPDYTRSIANSSFSYRWNGSKYLTHTFWPLEINYVQIYENSSSIEFLDSIRNTPLGYSFEDHLVTVARYGFELNNQTLGSSRNFIFLRLSMESAGIVLNALHGGIAADTSALPHKVFEVPYFQYLRGDFDFRYYSILDKQNKFVYRLFAGVGYPYGNSTTLPYEKKYFSGGPNSIRAWSTRDLGPGSFVDTTENSVFYFPNKNGDIKLEANLEYRFKVVWKLEGAIFLDVGNVWDFTAEPERRNAMFEWNRFYKELAVGTGFGARFDFSFFLLRFDFGIKLRDPALPENNRWIPLFKDFSIKDLNFKFGIGYPF